jgi:hypothetical protein
VTRAARFACAVLVACAALVVGGCGGGTTMTVPPDLGPACAAPAPDGGAACTSSPSCGGGAACFAGACRPIPTCANDCGCSGGRTCSGGVCVAAPGTACAPCDAACTAAGGTCRDGGCATACDDTTTFCPLGFRCDITGGRTKGTCIPTLTVGCAGCAADGDCPTGEVCNVNNRRCVATPTGPDARLEMTALDFAAGGGAPARNLTYSLGFFSRRDPSFDPFALAPGTCGSEVSSFTENAPFPVGPLRDAGDPLTLTLPTKTISFKRQQDPNPSFGFTYTGVGLMVADWTPGAASWSAPGGAAVGAFTAAGAIPPDFATTPDVLGMMPVDGDTTAGVTLGFDAPAPAGVGTWVEVSWNDISGSTVLSLTRIACRGPDGASSVTIPGAMLMNAPRSAQLGLTATRASVVPFTTTGVADGRAVFGTQRTGAVVIAP